MLCRPPLPSCQELSDVITQVFTFLTVSLELREIDRNPADCVCVHVWCGEERECVCLQGGKSLSCVRLLATSWTAAQSLQMNDIITKSGVPLPSL